MPTLEWIGKDKVVNHHLDVPYRVLDNKYTYGSDSENKIIKGDNLEALKALLPQYEGKIKCIYIDPPYNTGNEGWVYNDNVNDPKIKKWLGDVVGKEGEDLSRHDKWLCMMYPRLKLLQRLLAEDGAIFISIDDNEQANLKLICDEIYGTFNEIGPFIQNKMNAKNDTINVQKNHEFVLCYRKKPIYTENGKLNPTLINSERKIKDVFEENGEFYYINDAITTRGDGGILNARPNLGYTVYYNHVTKDKIGVCDYDIELAKTSNDMSLIYNDNLELINKGYFPIRAPKVRGKLGCWTWSLEKFNTEKHNIVITGKNNNFAVKKRTFVNASQVYIENNKFFYNNISYGNSKSILDFSTNEGTINLNNIMNESKVFDNPKNVNMIEYFIALLNDKNFIVLDSFAGSGTTAHAVLNMNKADGGNRKFILVEMEDYAETITAERVKRVIDGYSDFEGTGGGFTFYELGEPLLLDNKYLNENISVQKIREYIWFMETKKPLSQSQIEENSYYLNTNNDTAYYFYYEKDCVTTLNHNFLSKIKTKSESYVIYADKNTLSDDELLKFGITFKKIPRDIAKL